MKQLWDNLFVKNDPAADLIQLLKDCHIFQDLSQKELTFVKDLVHVRYYKPSEPIFTRGEVGVGMYVIGNGFVDIVVEDSVNDKDITTHVTRLKRGDFFGELALVEEASRRNATAKSSADSMLIGFFKPDLDEIIERSPSTGSKILFRLAQVLGRRLKSTSDKVTELKKELKKLADRK